ncbi:MAG: translation initiation factor IF-2 [candidate division Zixibacteria bacterium]|jgi:translation initiation factor IF-2|nr:translation initiation factor IF-2 [candidate division Zixibacteria bacterium]
MKKRVYDLAKEFNLSSKAMVDMVRGLGFEIKSHSSTVGDDVIKAVERKIKEQADEVKKGLEEKRRKEEERRREEEDKLRQKREAEKRILAELAKSKKKPPKKAEPKKVEIKRKKEKRRRHKEHIVDRKAVEASFRQTMSSLGGVKRKKYHRPDKDSQSISAEATNTIKVQEYITVSELAALMNVKPAQVVAKCMELGMMATINQRLDMDTIQTIALEFNYNVEEEKLYAEEEEIAEQEESAKLTKRWPVVTIMGHVDHGKTSLLDYIRKSNIVAGESGGITQHIGAYVVNHADGKITFLDTPGHEAFSAMRARGAQVTDIVVLVVAADDAVMPQTVEAIDHARAAGVPIIVAINKIDLPNINLDNIKNQLAKHNLVPEEWGGKTIMVEISAKYGTNVDKLLDMILLQAEMMELKANAERRALGVVVEARLDKGKGVICTILVQKGTLRVGDPFVCGVYSGKVRAMFDERGNMVTEAQPSVPVLILGADGVPQAGDAFVVTRSESAAKEISQKRLRLKRERDFRLINRIKLTDVYSRIKEGQIRELNLVIKGDADGSVEALSDTLSKIEHKEVAVRVIHRGVGAINESDVMLAAASDAIIIGFHVRPDIKAAELAQREGVDYRLYKIIYEVESDIKKALEGLLRPESVEIKTGAAEIRNIIKVPKVGFIAGSIVKDGAIKRNAKYRVLRNSVIISEGTITSLKRFKDDVREVQSGFECGIGLSSMQDVKEGDIIETFEITEKARTLD